MQNLATLPFIAESYSLVVHAFLDNIKYARDISSLKQEVLFENGEPKLLKSEFQKLNRLELVIFIFVFALYILCILIFA
jgi:hypothetical protein